MKGRIDKLLAKGTALKAREIAKQLGFERSEVSSLLHNNPGLYEQDGEFRWSLVRKGEVELTLPGDWVTADAFEKAFQEAGALLDGFSSSVRIVFPSGCKLMIDCTARLLALINQLANDGKTVTVDFTDAGATSTYLNRAGFFDHLRDEVIVLPKRPRGSAARLYQGQSETLVEFGSVDPKPKADNTELIAQLTKKFVQQS